MLKNSILLDLIEGKPITKTPIWLMRQAGRYLPEYRKTREQAGSFMNLCQTPELACKVTLQPLERFALDAAILFSDILTIPDALGLELAFLEGEGPVFNKKINSSADLDLLDWNNAITKLDYVYDAVKLIRQELPDNIPLIGFAGAPWTLACYMLEGQGSATYNKMKTLAYYNPEIANNLLSNLVLIITEYLTRQIIAGANVLMLFDTWGGLLPQQGYLKFSLYYMQQIIINIKKQYPHIPIIMFSKGAGTSLSFMQQVKADVIGLDWQTSILFARQILGNTQIIQGNLDPLWLTINNKNLFTKAVKEILEHNAGRPHIMNLGHGITPDARIENIHWLIDILRCYRAC